MSDIAFVDTNIFLYARDKRNLIKRAIAAETLLAIENLVISTQVVQEFYSAATRKLRMNTAEAAAAAESLCGLNMVKVGSLEILRGIAMERRYRLSFWDALILSAAETAGAAILYTEDFNHGQVFGAVRIVNPFRASLS